MDHVTNETPNLSHPPGSLLYRIRWACLGRWEGSWHSAFALPRSIVLPYHKRRRLSPHLLFHCMVKSRNYPGMWHGKTLVSTEIFCIIPRQKLVSVTKLSVKYHGISHFLPHTIPWYCLLYTFILLFRPWKFHPFPWYLLYVTRVRWSIVRIFVKSTLIISKHTTVWHMKNFQYLPW